MYNRYYNIKNDVDGSIFLFGARQTGKSTLLKKAFESHIFIDLLDGKIKRRLQRNPELLYSMLKDEQAGTLVVIDEIPEVPELLNEVHRLIQERQLCFVLCGSSARKLRRKGYNTLGGRAYPCYFYPLVSTEIPDWDLERALLYGMLPSVYSSQNPERRLASYVDVYLKEEIKQESIVRNLDGFQRFLEVAALTNGEIVNYNNIASDCGVAASTVREYFNILQDTLIGYMIPAYTKVVKRKLTQSPRFYYFDTGVANYLQRREQLIPGTAEYGHAFEHLVIQEIMAYIGYNHKQEQLSYWHTYSGCEVDAVIGDAKIAIEIKSTEEVHSKHLKGLRDFAEEHPNSRRILVSRDFIARREGEIELLPIEQFLTKLWAGEIF